MPTIARWAAGLIVAASLVALLPAIMGVFGAFFLFDAPGSTESRLTWAFAWGLWGAPVCLLAAAVMGVVALSSKSMTSLWIAAALLALPAVYIGTVVTLINVRCGGSFVCPPTQDR